MMDFSFFFEPPKLEASGILTIEALAPLSMASGQPGSYYQSRQSPSKHMLFGMLENALGWHIGSGSVKDPNCREHIFKALQKAAKKFNKSEAKSPWLTKIENISNSGFFSFLQYHLEIEFTQNQVEVLSYDDLWSQNLRDSGRSFFGGSRHYDARLESTITKARLKQIEFGDRTGFEDISLEESENLPEGAKVKYTSIRSRFPQYYASPKTREYVVPQSSYNYKLATTATLLTLIQQALASPAAPLYLGSNDGWVHAKIEKA